MKVQTTLTGYSAWIVQQLAEGKGQTIAEVTKYLVELWVDANRQFLEDNGIGKKEFKKTQRPGIVEFRKPADADSM